VTLHSKHRFANLETGGESPLNYAVAQRDLRTMTMVRDAIAHKQTLLAFQPVMRAYAPQQVAFYEGLIRVLDETGRVIPARNFIDVIEDTETGREIDVLALRAGLIALSNNPGLRLSINMSARSIGYKAWNNTLHRWLKKDPMLGERLILEITESSAMSMPEVVANFMNNLQPQGVCFAMDDFGAGYTAIRYFKEFYFDILKIDGQFIRGIAQDPDNRAVVSALKSIADHFEMLTVAESIETHADAETLIDMGIDCLQGFYFGAPTTRPNWMNATPRRATG
jgi:EAL domain-containing protein (putative c-di-GMP-specific phosphodiesterase class I)